MVDTIRSLSALQTLFADNTSGNISAQDLRDFLVSVFPYYWQPAVTGAYDDLFDSDQSVDWTTVAPDTGTAVVTYQHETRLGAMNRGVHVVFEDQAVGDFGAYLKPLTGIAIGDYVQGAFDTIKYPTSQDSSMSGVCLTDGVTTAANVAVSAVSYDSTTKEWKWTVGHGTLGDMTTFPTSDHFGGVAKPPHLRLIYTAANTFQARISLNGETFPSVLATFAKTMTPTHGGFVYGTYGAAGPAKLSQGLYFHSNVTP